LNAALRALQKSAYNCCRAVNELQMGDCAVQAISNRIRNRAGENKMDVVATIQEKLKTLFPGLMGFELTEAAPERIVATMLVRPDLCTSGDTLHGGAIMAFADTLGAIGTIVNMPQGARTTTIESKTNFIGGAPVGSRVTGESTPFHRGRTTMVWQTIIRNDKGKLVAVVTQTQMVLPAAS
jgi:uncharacterized protein (TIGR00369 family)